VNAFLRMGRLVARTARGLRPGLARPDDAFAAHHLAGAELAAYRRMDPRDRDHACRVARGLLAAVPDADPLWVRAALLHDVGKSGVPYRVWERVVVHLWTPGEALLRRAPRVWAAAWRRHRDHAAVGAAALRAAGVDPRVADLVERHHRPSDGDEALRRLAEADEAA
jgi:putative nucleotidyltransferase with HDIG domain